MEKELFSVNEAAQILGLSPATVRRWVFDRRLEVVKLGRRVLLKRQILDRLIQSGTRPALNGISAHDTR